MDFENTKLAFEYLDDSELRRAHRLFRLMGLPLLGSIGPWIGRWAFQWHLPFSGALGQMLFDHFCGGESLDDCKDTVGSFFARGVYGILDYSVEGQQSESSFEEAKLEILRCIDYSANQQEGSLPFSVFKCTSICHFGLLERFQRSPETLSSQEREAWQRFENRVDEICRTAHSKGIRIFIDAEESWIQGAIDHIAEKMMSKYNRESTTVFTTLQMYRTDRLLYANELVRKASDGGFRIGAKIVRGAYMEKERSYAKKAGIPSAVHGSKNATDHDYNLCIDFFLAQSDRASVCVASHNEESVRKVTDKIRPDCREAKDLWFSQLMGMSDNLTFSLAAGGYQVAKYIPYGPLSQVMPYLMRRAQENSSVKGQVGRELGLLRREIMRRSN